MYVSLFYLTCFISVNTAAAAGDDDDDNDNDDNDEVANFCQSLVENVKSNATCRCVDQLMEIRCHGLTHVPQFSRVNSVFAGVYMARQFIRELEADAFAHLPARRLVLNFNEIEDRLDSSAFSGNLSDVVRELYVGSCRLRGLPSGLLDNMHSLLVLHLWHNNVEQIPGDLFVSCENLQELVLSYNVIGSLDERTFSGLRSLRKLDLDGNKISVLEPEIFSQLTNLRILHLRYNKVTVLSADTFSSMGNTLHILSLDGNGLEFIYSRAFDGLTQLKILSLGDNKMTFLPGDTFTNMFNLTILILRRSNLSSLFSRLFDKLIGLKRLDLSGNTLTHVPVGSLRNSRQVRCVDLSDNDLTTLSSCVLPERAAQLRTLSLLGNSNLQCDCRLTWLTNLRKSANIWGSCTRAYGSEGPVSVIASLQYDIAGCSFDMEDCMQRQHSRAGRDGLRRRAKRLLQYRRVRRRHQRLRRRPQST